MVPEVFLDQRTDADRRSLECQPVAVRVDFHPIHVLLGRLEDHPADHRLGLAHAPEDAAQAAHHIFHVFHAVGIELAGGLVDFSQESEQQAEAFVGAVPGELDFVPARQGVGGWQDALLVGVLADRLAFTLKFDELVQGLEESARLILQPPGQVGGAAHFLVQRGEVRGLQDVAGEVEQVAEDA